MISGFPDVSPSPKTSITYLVGHQDTLTIQEKPKHVLGNSVFVNLETLEILIFESFGKDGRREIMKIHLKNLGNIEYDINSNKSKQFQCLMLRQAWPGVGIRRNSKDVYHKRRIRKVRRKTKTYK